MCGVTDPQPADMPVLLPKDSIDAVREVLTQVFSARVKAKDLVNVLDTLDNKHLEKKYHNWPLMYDKNTKRYELLPLWSASALHEAKLIRSSAFISRIL
jgi:hypothetical protein